MCELRKEVVQPYFFADIDFFSVQAAIMSAGAGEEFVTITSKTNEPIVTTMDPDSDTATSLLSPEQLTPYQVWQLQKKKAELLKAHLDLWQSTVKLTGTGRPVDAIIAPVASSAAPPHGKNRLVKLCIFLHDTPTNG